MFVPYDVTDETNNSWGAPAGITVKIDVPQGDQALVDTAICHIVNESFEITGTGTVSTQNATPNLPEN